MAIFGCAKRRTGGFAQIWLRGVCVDRWTADGGRWAVGVGEGAAGLGTGVANAILWPRVAIVCVKAFVNKTLAI